MARVALDSPFSTIPRRAGREGREGFVDSGTVESNKRGLILFFSLGVAGGFY